MQTFEFVQLPATVKPTPPKTVSIALVDTVTHREKMYVVAGGCNIRKIKCVVKKGQRRFQKAFVTLIYMRNTFTRSALILWSLSSSVFIVLQYAFLIWCYVLGMYVVCFRTPNN